MKTCLGALLLSAFAAVVSAAAKDAQIDGYGTREILWGDAPWNPAGVPAAGDSVTINTGENSAGSTLALDGAAVSSGALVLEGYTDLTLRAGASYAASETADIRANSSLNLQDSSFSAAGSVYVNSQAALSLRNSSASIDPNSSDARIQLRGGAVVADGSTFNAVVRTNSTDGNSLSFSSSVLDARAYAGTQSIIDGTGSKNSYVFDNSKVYAGNSAGGYRIMGFYGLNTSVEFSNGSLFQGSSYDFDASPATAAAGGNAYFVTSTLERGGDSRFKVSGGSKFAAGTFFLGANDELSSMTNAASGAVTLEIGGMRPAPERSLRQTNSALI